ncbi:MAG: zinc ABC transporter substrate-binding protein, partial [Deltaproteobacteria bacterium]|nr:zinc ABC transporter substrate-binding protein [Deltaproteobacteria bacterium]
MWLDPELVKIQAATVCKALSAVDPAGKRFYDRNLREFLTELDKLNRDIAEAFRTLSVKKLMVFHPAWGYFAERYGLEQIPIEVEGKEPGPRELAAVIEYAKKEKIKVIFVQSQFSTEQAEAVA